MPHAGLCRAVQGVAVARWTFGRPARSKRNLPDVSAAGTLKRSLFRHLDLSSFNSQRSPSTRAWATFFRAVSTMRPKVCANAHSVRGLFLIESLIVGQPQGFQFIDGEDDLAQRARRDSRRLEERGSGQGSNTATALSVAAWNSLHNFNYEHTLITCQAGFQADCENPPRSCGP